MLNFAKTLLLATVLALGTPLSLAHADEVTNVSTITTSDQKVIQVTRMSSGEVVFTVSASGQELAPIESLDSSHVSALGPLRVATKSRYYNGAIHDDIGRMFGVSRGEAGGDSRPVNW